VNGKWDSLRAVLLDLDDTLLGNDMERFLPPYFAALGRRMAQFVAPDDLVKMLLASTRVMMKNDDPAVTNQQVFDADFFPRLGRPAASVRPTIAAFYEEDFPALKRHTQARPLARSLVQALFDRGYDVVIATNPMFPRRAIEHRLDWAGVLDFPFKLITSYENSHFCKPNPHYYEEIVDRLDCRPDQAIMVGDDLANDILPAAQVGLRTYWIVDPPAQAGLVPYAGLHGSLADCLAWVQSDGLTDQKVVE
jgi:HAD superfamily hydrolase (TIGR01662 family)